ncbi:MAG: V-type ATP synthase subunit I [Lachnospiraceae bacterium]
MAKLTMKRILICGLRKNRKAVLEIIQREGCVEVQGFIEEDDIFQKSVMPISAAEFERSVRDCENALEILTEFDGEKPGGILSSFKGRDVIEQRDYDEFRNEYSAVLGAVNDILDNYKQIAENKAEIVKCNQQMDILDPWKSLDMDINFEGTEQTAAFIGSLPGKWILEDIYGIFEENEPVDVNVVSKSKFMTNLMVISRRDRKEEVSAALRGAGFVYPPVSGGGIPTEERERLLEKIEKLKKDNKICAERILSGSPMKDSIRFMRDHLTIREEKYKVINNLPQSANTIAFSGYIPERSIPRLKEALRDYDVVIETEDPAPGEDVPVILKNNAYSSTVQGIVEAYALPDKGEVDPSFIISLFYPIFFGFMLADAAIGVLMVIATTILLLANKNMERNMKNNVRLFLFGGISTIFWGVMFGGYFGDAIPVIAREFLGMSAESAALLVKPLWLDMTANPMAVLSLSLGLGTIHLFTGLGIAGYQMLKQKDFVGFLFDVVAWYFILAGLLVKCFSMPMIMSILFGGRTPFLSDRIGNIGLYAAAAGALAVIIMAGRSSKNPLKRLLKGLYAVYGVTGYLSDVLSYSRLLALGLATGVISSVANMIGTMFGTGVVRIIIFILIFIVINLINIGINVLGAYVHTNRLQYVEFFGKFYDGGGRPFQPFSIKTKYYKFKEN